MAKRVKRIEGELSSCKKTYTFPTDLTVECLERIAREISKAGFEGKLDVFPTVAGLEFPALSGTVNYRNENRYELHLEGSSIQATLRIKYGVQEAPAASEDDVLTLYDIVADNIGYRQSTSEQKTS